MGKDTSWKEFFADNSRYADLINGLVCGGRQLVAEEDLQELDSQTGFFRNSIASQDQSIFGRGFSGRWRKADTRGKRIFDSRRKLRIRDMVRKVAFGVNFVVIGIENQEIIDYSIVLRNMSYDVGEYEKQAAKIRKDVRKHSKDLSAGEYLYGFRKDSRLHPVVTFILYAGIQEWDGSKSLQGIMDFTDIPHEVQAFVGNYRINLIELRKWKDTSVFQTDVRQVFDFIRCAEDKEALAKLVEGDPYYRAMEEDAYDVVARYTHADQLVWQKDFYRKDDKIDMCTAIKEMVEDGIREGIREGIKEGIDRGEELLSELLNRLFADGRTEEVQKVLKDKSARKRLYKEYGLTDENRKESL